MQFWYSECSLCSSLCAVWTCLIVRFDYRVLGSTEVLKLPTVSTCEILYKRGWIVCVWNRCVDG